jgi:hypothetical protein
VDINIDTVYDCHNIGGDWTTGDYYFDNIVIAVLTLFSKSTTEGWGPFMEKAASIRGIGYEPIENSAPGYRFYFIIFIIIGNFFIWNLYIGVVVSTFNSEKEKLGKNYLLTGR